MNIFFLKTGIAEFNRFYKWIFLHIIPAQIIFPFALTEFVSLCSKTEIYNVGRTGPTGFHPYDVK